MATSTESVKSQVEVSSSTREIFNITWKKVQKNIVIDTIKGFKKSTESDKRVLKSKLGSEQANVGQKHDKDGIGKPDNKGQTRDHAPVDVSDSDMKETAPQIDKINHRRKSKMRSKYGFNVNEERLVKILQRHKQYQKMVRKLTPKVEWIESKKNVKRKKPKQQRISREVCHHQGESVVDLTHESGSDGEGSDLKKTEHIRPDKKPLGNWQEVNVETEKKRYGQWTDAQIDIQKDQITNEKVESEDNENSPALANQVENSSSLVQASSDLKKDRCIELIIPKSLLNKQEVQNIADEIETDNNSPDVSEIEKNSGDQTADGIKIQNPASSETHITDTCQVMPSSNSVNSLPKDKISSEPKPLESDGKVTTLQQQCLEKAEYESSRKEQSPSNNMVSDTKLKLDDNEYDKTVTKANRKPRKVSISSSSSGSSSNDSSSSSSSSDSDSDGTVVWVESARNVRKSRSRRRTYTSEAPDRSPEGPALPDPAPAQKSHKRSRILRKVRKNRPISSKDNGAVEITKTTPVLSENASKVSEVKDLNDADEKSDSSSDIDEEIIKKYDLSLEVPDQPEEMYSDSKSHEENKTEIALPERNTNSKKSSLPTGPLYYNVRGTNTLESSASENERKASSSSSSYSSSSSSEDESVEQSDFDTPHSPPSSPLLSLGDCEEIAREFCSPNSDVSVHLKVIPIELDRDLTVQESVACPTAVVDKEEVVPNCPAGKVDESHHGEVGTNPKDTTHTTHLDTHVDEVYTPHRSVDEKEIIFNESLNEEGQPADVPNESPSSSPQVIPLDRSTTDLADDGMEPQIVQLCDANVDLSVDLMPVTPASPHQNCDQGRLGQVESVVLCSAKPLGKHKENDHPLEFGSSGPTVSSVVAGPLIIPTECPESGLYHENLNSESDSENFEFGHKGNSQGFNKTCEENFENETGPDSPDHVSDVDSVDGEALEMIDKTENKIAVIPLHTSLLRQDCVEDKKSTEDQKPTQNLPGDISQNIEYSCRKTDSPFEPDNSDQNCPSRTASNKAEAEIDDLNLHKHHQNATDIVEKSNTIFSVSPNDEKQASNDIPGDKPPRHPRLSKSRWSSTSKVKTSGSRIGKRKLVRHSPIALPIKQFPTTHCAAASEALPDKCQVNSYQFSECKSLTGEHSANNQTDPEPSKSISQVHSEDLKEGTESGLMTQYTHHIDDELINKHHQHVIHDVSDTNSKQFIGSSDIVEYRVDSPAVNADDDMHITDINSNVCEQDIPDLSWPDEPVRKDCGESSYIDRECTDRTTDMHEGGDRELKLQSRAGKHQTVADTVLHKAADYKDAETSEADLDINIETTEAELEENTSAE